MTSRTRSSSSYSRLSRTKKAQFFILGAFAIVTVMFFLSQWIEPFRILDTSSAVLNDEIFIFNNIHEQAEKIVLTSGNCEDLKFNLEEFKSTAVKFLAVKNMELTFNFDTSACADSAITASFYIALVSPSVSVDDSFTVSQ